jgi:precorrin-2 dehydrogenase/sirohydrochlorin ferrochelatase
MNLYPIELKLDGRLCLTAGTGAVGERKIAGLLECGARVRAAGPVATPRVEAWAATGEITWVRREFVPEDLADVFLVIAATDNAAVNERIAALAAERGLLVNVADTPALCNFYLPAVMRRGSLNVAVSTGGVSPGLAARLRDKIAAGCGPEYEEYLALLAAYREKAFAHLPREADRREFMLRLSGDEALDLLGDGADALRSYMAGVWAEFVLPGAGDST